MFNPINTRWAICAPPVNSKFVLSTATSLEKISSGIFSHFAGIIIVEAEKKNLCWDTLNYNKTFTTNFCSSSIKKFTTGNFSTFN